MRWQQKNSNNTCKMDVFFFFLSSFNCNVSFKCVTVRLNVTAHLNVTVRLHVTTRLNVTVCLNTTRRWQQKNSMFLGKLSYI